MEYITRTTLEAEAKMISDRIKELTEMIEACSEIHEKQKEHEYNLMRTFITAFNQMHEEQKERMDELIQAINWLCEGTGFEHQ